MKAMVLRNLMEGEWRRDPLELAELPVPPLKEGEVLLRVKACGVCHTELDEIEGRTPPPQLPVVLGHEVAGVVQETCSREGSFKPGDRAGVGWIYSSCGQCEYCLKGEENLCPRFKATGRDADGGYAEYMKVPEGFAYPIPDAFSHSQAAPLMCAGAIGYRSLRLCGIKNGQKLGLTGFGASAHLVLQTARYRYPEVRIFVFARNPAEREFALQLGAEWAGHTGAECPEKLDCIIDTTPVWKPVVEALKNLAAGGRLVINAIRKENVDRDYLMKLDYPAHLWYEKEIKSVANVTRRDISEFLEVAAEIGIKPEIQEFPLVEANAALSQLKGGKARGAKVLRI